MDCKPDFLEHISASVLERITDDIILGLCFEVHRAVKLNKMNSFFIEEPEEYGKKYEIQNESYNIFGKECDSAGETLMTCPHCLKKTVSCQKFMGHLVTCIGRGRNAKVKSMNKIHQSMSQLASDESDIDDHTKNVKNDDGDDEWGSKRKPKKTNSGRGRKAKNAPKERNAVKAKEKNGAYGAFVYQ